MNEIEIPPKIKYKDKQIEIGELKLNYWEVGKGQETLLFIHGFTGNIEEWYLQILEFEKTHKILAVDLRGHGKSEIKGDKLTITDISNDINQFLEKKGYSKVILVGHSMGGMIALHFALRFPDKVRKLVLISTTAGGSHRKISDSQIEFIKSTTVDKLIDMMSKVASIPLHKIKPERREFYKKLQYWSKKRRGEGISNNTFIIYLKATSDFDVRNRIHEIKMPTLIVCGDKDNLVKRQNSKLMDERIPNSKMIIFHECGHAPQREYFVEFNKKLKEFLNC